MKQRMKIKTIVFIVSILLFSSRAVPAQEYITEKGKAIFKATMPLKSYTGESEVLKGNINLETGVLDFSLSVKSIKTGVSKRDEDMYELLNINKYPDVTFKGQFVDPFNPNTKNKQSLEVKGNFTLAGTTREILIPIELTPEGQSFLVTASWEVLITDYNIKRPQKFFLRVDDKHELNIEAILSKKEN